MNTKVKGDKIKEGSIPMSALKPNRYNLSNNEDINEVKKAISEFKVGFTIIQNSFYSNVYITNISKVGGSVYNITGIHEGMTFKVTIDINKISNPLFTDDNKIDASGPTPDWDAQQGDPGYIKNKTHYLSDKSEYTLGKGVTQIPYNSERFACTKNGIIELPSFKNGLEIFIVTDPPVFIKYIIDEKDGRRIIELIDNYNYFANETIEFYNALKTINDVFIPDTVIKTTPQTLSNIDKNQALANLGIDPVVWKYLCNPFRACDCQPIPDELHSIIYTKNKTTLNTIVKMY